MKYKLNSNVVLVSVLDENMLVCVDTAAGGLRNMRSVNSTGAYFWGQLEKGLDTEDIISQAMQHYGIPRDTAESAFMSYFKSLCDAGYLTAEN